MENNNPVNNPSGFPVNNKSQLPINKPVILASVAIVFLIIILGILSLFGNKNSEKNSAGGSASSSIFGSLFGGGKSKNGNQTGSGSITTDKVSIPDNQSSNPSDQTTSGNTSGNQTYPGSPEVKVSNWIVQAQKPASSPNQAQIYTFKTSFSEDDAVFLAKKLLGTNIGKEKGSKLIGFYPLESADKQTSMFFYNTQVGTFSYASTAGLGLSGENNTAEEKIDKFVKNFIPDSTLKMSASYKRKDQAGLKYFEYHRDWKEIGLPILNPLGLLNMPENQLLSNVSLTNNSNNLAKDDQVYNTSDSTEGLARQNDFNTVTAAINESSQTVVALNSNLRPLNLSLVKSQSLLSYEEAVIRLKANQYDMLVSQPAGQGVPDYSKVYPGNKATTKQATVTDAILAYLEQSPSSVQSSLEPYYVFKGYTTLDSGYRVNFIATVKAVSNQLKVQSKSSNPVAVLGDTTTATPPAQQQSTITFPSNCKGLWDIGNYPISKLVNIRQLGQVKVGDGTTPYAGSTYTWVFYIPEGQLEINAAINAARSSGVYGRDTQYFIKDYLSALENPECAVRISGGSPSIFVYLPDNQKAVISLSKNQLTYVDPEIIDNSWQVKNIAGKLYSQSGTRDFLYYEYDLRGVNFKKPAQGWLIDRHDVGGFVKKNIGPLLNLNGLESERAVFEIKQAASGVKGDKLFVGLVSRDEIDRNIPLSVSNTVAKVYRYHFYVGSSGDNIKNLSQPKLSPIDRHGSFLLEIGGIKGD